MIACLRTPQRLFVLAAAFGCFLWGQGAAGQTRFLFEIGKADGNNAEFALAPRGHASFRADGFFVVGRSDPKTDWPYVQPGPADPWAGSRQHTFTIVFALKRTPEAGECHFRIQLLDTHSHSPPELSVSINGRESRYRMPPGAGDASVYGEPAKGKPHSMDVVFPANALRLGANEISIGSVSGSWVLYDWLGLEAPAGAELGEASGTIISSADSPPVLIHRDGQLRQLAQVTIAHFGDPADVTLLAEGKAATNLTLKSGIHNLEIVVPAVEKQTPLPLSIQAAGKSIASRVMDLKPVRKWTVYLLPHSHVDIGYTHVQTEVERAQWKYLEMGIEAARKSAAYPEGSRFKWNTEVLWAVDSYLKQASPEKQKEFFKAVRAGWVGLDALYGNELTGLCRPEEMLRLVGFGAKLGDRAGVPIVSAMITDVPGYSWGIVPTFARAGVKYFSIGPNGGDRIGHTIAARGDKPFWWVGPNGKDKVLVWMTGTGYYRVFQSAQMLQNYLAGLEAKGYPYDMVQVRHCLGDNGAPDVNFADTVKQWNETYAYPKLVIATTAEMFRQFESRYGAQIPVVKGDFTPYWEDGAASSARETAMNRASADRLTQAETLFAMLSPRTYPADEFYAAWRNVVLYDEHTWGAHNSISQPDAPFVKSQWAIKQAFALEADKQSRELLLKALNQSSAPPTQERAMDIFNTCSWERSDLVVLSPEMSKGAGGVCDARGQTIPSQRLSTGELAFVARGVPAFGAKRYVLAREPGRASGTAKVNGVAIQNANLSLRLDEKTGVIASLTHKSLGAPLVDFNTQVGLNKYLYLPGSDLKNLQPAGPARIRVKESGPVVASLLVESDAPGCNGLSCEIRIVDGLDRVDIIDTLDKKAVRAKEGIHVGFSFNVPGGTLRMDVPWGVVRPEVGQIAGACKNWFTVQRWVDISNQDYGVAWATPDAPLVEVGGITANLIGSLPNPKVWMNHIENSQTVYSWVMNNHWHTNYRAEQDGPTVFRYSIWPHKALRMDDVARFGAACSQPLVAHRASTKEDATPRLSIQGPGVLVSGLKPSEDGGALILRLFGASDAPGRAKISWSSPPPTQVTFTDAAEKIGTPATGSIDVPPWTIVTLRAELPK